MTDIVPLLPADEEIMDNEISCKYGHGCRMIPAAGNK